MREEDLAEYAHTQKHIIYLPAKGLMCRVIKVKIKGALLTSLEDSLCRSGWL